MTLPIRSPAQPTRPPVQVAKSQGTILNLRPDNVLSCIRVGTPSGSQRNTRQTCSADFTYRTKHTHIPPVPLSFCPLHKCLSAGTLPAVLAAVPRSSQAQRLGRHPAHCRACLCRRRSAGLATERVWCIPNLEASEVHWLWRRVFRRPELARPSSTHPHCRLQLAETTQAS